MIGTITAVDVLAGTLTITGEDETHQASKLALFDVAFDAGAVGLQVSYVLHGRYATNVRRWPRTRTAIADSIPQNVATIKFVSSAGDFCFCEVPKRTKRNSYLHVSQLSVGRILESWIGRKVRFNHLQKQDGREHIIGARLVEDGT